MARAQLRDGAGLLGGLTVVDLTQHLSGPYATQILGDLGARVIKVEPPGGDPSRAMGPHFRDGQSAYFLAINRNKESVCIDLKSPSGPDVFLALVSRADVVVENFRPGTLEKLGVGYDAIVGANPKAVLCSITGFGQDGPYRDHPAFDMVVQALSGGMSLTGEEGGHPVRSGLPIGDLCAGMYGAIGIVGGLLKAASSGQPSHVDVSMLDSQIAMLSYVASYYLIGGHLAGLQGRGHMSIPTYRSWSCADGTDVVTAVNTERQWKAFCRAMDVPDVVQDPRFATNDLRREHKAELYRILEPAVGSFTSAELIARLHGAEVPVAPINRVDEALRHPQVQHRQMVVDVAGADEPCLVVGNPVKTRGRQARVEPPPTLGQHTRQVFRELAGMKDGEIDALIESGALASDEGAAK